MRSLTSTFSARACKVGKISRPLLTVDDLICMLKEGFYACIQLQKVIKWSKVLPINGTSLMSDRLNSLSADFECGGS